MHKGIDCPFRSYGTIWLAPDDESYYLYGGFRADESLINAYSFGDYKQGYNVNVSSQATDNALWRYVPSNQAGGAWGRVMPTTMSVIRSTFFPAGGSSAFGNGAGYLLGGGTSDNGDEPSNLHPLPLGGLLTYNMTSNTWHNESAVGYTPTSTSLFGRMHFVPSFGPSGLLVAMGGEAAQNRSYWSADGSTAFGFDKIGVYDTTSRAWYYQTAVGATLDAIPSPRSNFCSVGVAGDNGTYEIFVYGGQLGNSHWSWSMQNAAQAAANATNGAKTGVHVLSLPSFTWFKADDVSAAPRYGHACEVVGNRQMLSVGGLNATVDPYWAFLDQDRSVYGLNLFDIVDLKWKDAYNASAAVYTTPDVIRQYHRANGDTAKWDDPKLGTLFQRSTNELQPGNAIPSGTAPAASNKPPTFSTGFLVGLGIGGCAFIALLLVVALLIRRRRGRWRRALKTSHAPPIELDGPAKAELPGLRWIEADGSARHEVGGYAKYGADAVAMHELPGVFKPRIETLCYTEAWAEHCAELPSWEAISVSSAKAGRTPRGCDAGRSPAGGRDSPVSESTVVECPPPPPAKD